MSKNPDTVQATIPGLEPPTVPNGVLEAEVDRQIEALRGLGYIEDHHAGQVALAKTCARDLDRSFGRGAPSGRANLLRVMNEILETLPHPEAASKDKLDEVVAAMMSETDDEVADVVRASA